MSKLKILIVEDEPIIAENIALYLDNNDFEVAAIAYDAEEAMEHLAKQIPDAAILDINFESKIDGIELAQHINEKYRIPFLFLTSYSDKSTLERAKNVKPSGYIVKPFNENTIQASIQIAISNHISAQNLALPKLNLEKINKHIIAQLTEREFEITEQIYNGITNTQIAESLFITVNTVKTHLKSIYLKLDVGSRIGAINKIKELMRLN